jgi:hypothetical protein
MTAEMEKKSSRPHGKKQENRRRMVNFSNQLFKGLKIYIYGNEKKYFPI